MTNIRLALAFIAAVLLPGSVHARGDFVDLRRVEAIRGDAAAGAAKAAACVACHGADGISPVPMFPNLAGQSAEYLYWSLLAFQREARADSPMTAVVAALADVDLRDLAAHFAAMPRIPAQPSAATGDGDGQRGGALYRNGDRARGVPPCQGCHGTDGGGHPLADTATAWRTYPALRNQHAAYVVQKLADYRDGRHKLTSNDQIMRGVARTLDEADMRDIAAWLETLPP